MDTKQSQCKMILQYIADFGSITSLDAIRELDCIRLPARISDLRKAGFPIVTTYEKRINRSGQTKRYARYSLDGDG